MNWKFWANTTLCCLLLVLFMMSVQAMSVSSIPELLQPTVKISESVKEMSGQVKLDRFGIRMKNENNGIDALFSFENSSEHDIRNIAMVCEIFDKKGRFLGQRKWLIGETIEMSSKKTVLIEGKRMFIPVRRSKIECRIADMDILKKPTGQSEKAHEKTSDHGEKKPEGTSGTNH